MRQTDAQSTPPKSIKVLLVDDHTIVREGLRALLEKEPDIQVVAETSSGLKVLELAQNHAPDVLIVDLMIPDLNGLEITRLLRKKTPDARILILSMYANTAYVANALRNGARGYVLKGSGMGELLGAIRTIATGGHYLSRLVDKDTVLEYLNRTSNTSMDLYEILTRREQEVLNLAAHGYTNTEIGARLFISPRTVEIHRSNFMRKLNLRSHSDLVRFAIERGILLVESDPAGPGKQPLHQ